MAKLNQTLAKPKQELRTVKDEELPQPKNGYHKITGNESMGTIAARYGVNPQAILNSNPGMITPAAGAFIRIPNVIGGVGGFDTGAGRRTSGRTDFAPIVGGDTVEQGGGSRRGRRTPLEKIQGSFGGVIPPVINPYINPLLGKPITQDAVSDPRSTVPITPRNEQGVARGLRSPAQFGQPLNVTGSVGGFDTGAGRRGSSRVQQQGSPAAFNYASLSPFYTPPTTGGRRPRPDVIAEVQGRLQGRALPPVYINPLLGQAITQDAVSNPRSTIPITPRDEQGVARGLRSPAQDRIGGVQGASGGARVDGRQPMPDFEGYLREKVLSGLGLDGMNLRPEYQGIFRQQGQQQGQQTGTPTVSPGLPGTAPKPAGSQPTPAEIQADKLQAKDAAAQGKDPRPNISSAIVLMEAMGSGIVPQTISHDVFKFLPPEAQQEIRNGYKLDPNTNTWSSTGEGGSQQTKDGRHLITTAWGTQVLETPQEYFRRTGQFLDGGGRSWLREREGNDIYAPVSSADQAVGTNQPSGFGSSGSIWKI